MLMFSLKTTSYNFQLPTYSPLSYIPPRFKFSVYSYNLQLLNPFIYTAMGRAPCCDKANVKRGPWSPEEDATLRNYLEKHGTGGNWIALPQKAGLKRCGKSCRLRWLNYLRPHIRLGGFTEEEDKIICTLYSTVGSRWSLIAAQLQGRTDNDVKNHWNTKLKKKFMAGNANINGSSKMSNGTSYFRLSSFPPQPRGVEGFVFDRNNSVCFEPLDQNQPMESQVSDFGTSVIQSCGMPSSEQVSTSSACLAQENNDHTRWFGFKDADQDDVNLLDFVYDDLLKGFAA